MPASTQNGTGPSHSSWRTFVKICGITNLHDAHAAIESGADALGFICVQESPRFVGVTAFRRIQEILPEGFPLVIVVKRLRDAFKYEAKIAQFYDPVYHVDDVADSVKRIQVMRVNGSEGIGEAQATTPDVDAVLLDTMSTTVLGGSGTKFDWALASDLRDKMPKPFLLAGGLNPANVAQALDAIRPYGVDVASGVEGTIPGAKDHRKVDDFIKNVRRWDESIKQAANSDIPSLFDIFKP